jgi:hypothetical protein
MSGFHRLSIHDNALTAPIQMITISALHNLQPCISAVPHVSPILSASSISWTTCYYSGWPAVLPTEDAARNALAVPPRLAAVGCVELSQLCKSASHHG